MSKQDFVAEIRRQIESEQLSNDRLVEACLWLGREMQRDKIEKKRKKLGVQLLVLLAVVIIALWSGTWIFQTLIRSLAALTDQ